MRLGNSCDLLENYYLCIIKNNRIYYLAQLLML